MALSKDEIKALAEELKPSVLEAVGKDTDKIVEDKLSKSAPKILTDITEAQKFLTDKVTEFSADLPASLRSQYNTLVNSVIRALSGTPNQVTKENIDEVLTAIKEKNFDKALIERERALEGTSSDNADKGTTIDDNKNDPKGDGDTKSKNDTAPRGDVQSSDGTPIEFEKKAEGGSDGDSDEQDILTKFPLAHDGVYVEARKKKYLESKTTGKGKSSADLVKNIDLGKYKESAQQ